VATTTTTEVGVVVEGGVAQTIVTTHETMVAPPVAVPTEMGRMALCAFDAISQGTLQTAVLEPINRMKVHLCIRFCQSSYS
jgi:hypothetical protein